LFRKYLFSLDHKVIGLQYALTSLIFLLIGFGLAVVFRRWLAYPGKAVPLVGSLFGELNAPGRVPLPEIDFDAWLANQAAQLTPANP
jgi:cytochrome c oxidase subunit 1